MTNSGSTSGRYETDLAAYRADPLQLDRTSIKRLAMAILDRHIHLSPAAAAEIVEQAVAIGADEPDHRFGQYLASLGDDASTRWMPTPPGGALHWNVQTTIDGAAVLTVDSPRVSAWFLEADERIEEVIIVGRGAPRLQALLDQVTLNAALALPRDTSALLLDGLIWITADTYVDVIEAGSSSWSSDEKALASDVFTLLKIELQELQSRSALVRVTSFSDSDRVKRALVPDALKKLATRAREEKRSLTLSGPRGEQSIAAVVPIRKIGRPIPFTVPFAKDVLSTREFNLLYERALEESLRRTRGYAQRRLEFYEDHLAQHERQYKHYQSLSPTEKAVQDREKVIVSSIIDFKLAITVAMAVPEAIPGHVFYNQNLPQLIQNDEQWVARTGSSDPSIGT